MPGPEKLLEVWFAASPAAIPESARDAETGKIGLKRVSNETWTEMLDLVNCKVLSVVDSEEVDAYLLSESSMFVFAHKVILKTCGTTTLLLGLQNMLQAAVSAGFPGDIADHVAKCVEPQPCKYKDMAIPYRVFYSRKNFLFPDRQLGPHRSWSDEVGLLDKTFKNGSAYLVGKMNGDHWYLWLMGPDGAESTETKTKHFQLGVDNEDDETLEVLMTDLDEENAKQFYLADAIAAAEKKFLPGAGKNTLANSTESFNEEVFSAKGSEKGTATPDTLPEELTTEGHALGTLVSEGCGLSSVYTTDKYPDAVVDSYMFNPCGFSANGVIPAPPSEIAPDGEPKKASTHYFTVHVTPEPICSYASFETNLPAKQTGRATKDIIQHVVGIFKPGRFSVTLFEARAVAACMDEISAASSASPKMDDVPGYRCTDRIVHGFEGYDLVFRYYVAHNWVATKNSVKIGERI